MAPEHDILSKTLKDFEDGYAWNAIGSFGLILFGLVLIFPGSYRLLELTRSVLTTSSSIGFTTFYVSITTAILETPFGDLSPSLFDRSIAASSSITLIAIFLTFSNWYPALLIGSQGSPASKFIEKIKLTSLSFRLFFGAIFCFSMAVGMYSTIVGVPTKQSSAPEASSAYVSPKAEDTK